MKTNISLSYKYIVFSKDVYERHEELIITRKPIKKINEKLTPTF